MRLTEIHMVGLMQSPLGCAEFTDPLALRPCASKRARTSKWYKKTECRRESAEP